MMQISISVPHAQGEAWLAQFARNADNNAFGGALLLQPYPATLAGQIAAVVALGHHAFNTWHQREPVRGLIKS